MSDCIDLNAHREAIDELVRASQQALWAWTRMPDAAFAEGSPRWIWWNDTAQEREALRAALAPFRGAA